MTDQIEQMPMLSPDLMNLSVIPLMPLHAPFTVRAFIVSELQIFNLLQVPASVLENGADILEVWTGTYDLSQAWKVTSLTGQWEAQTIYSANNYLSLRLITDQSILLPASLLVTFTSGTVQGISLTRLCNIHVL